MVDASYREELSLKVSTKLELWKNVELYFTEDTFLDKPVVQKERLLFQLEKRKDKCFFRIDRAGALLSEYTHFVSPLFLLSLKS